MSQQAYLYNNTANVTLLINIDISHIRYDDIKSLLEQKEPESDLLDYKKEMIDDEKLAKHVCAFANTRGGHMVFGVEEPGGGESPTSIPGLAKSTFDKERLGRIILSNVVPRLDVRIESIEIPDSEKIVGIIQIPDSYLKPHQSNITHRFYKRFNTESSPMNEGEISNLYRSRFLGYKQASKYVKEILASPKKDAVAVSMVVIPLNIERRLIDTSNSDNIKKIASISITQTHPEPFPNHLLKPFSHGFISEYKNPDSTLEIHRNGCLQYIKYYNHSKDDTLLFPHKLTGQKLIQLLEFAASVLSIFNYFGDVRIIVKITCPSRSAIFDQDGFILSYSLDSLDSTIERLHPVSYVGDNRREIAQCIMNEACNHYGLLECPTL